MKKVTVSLILVISFFLMQITDVNAQKLVDVTEEKPNYQYLFEKIENVSIFVSPMVQFPLFTEKVRRKSGLGAAIIVNKEWYVGYYNLNSKDDGCSNCNYLNHNGFWLGYIVAKNNQYHVTPSLKLGSGSYGGDNVFVFNPQIGIETNLFKWAKAEAGVGYQIVNGLDNVESDGLNGLYLGLDLKIGWFANPLFGN